MLTKLIRIFWPDLSNEEIKKYGLLSLAFFFTIGGYWLLRPLKDGFFFNVVGGEFQPRAKMLSVVLVTLLVLVYSKLVDMVEKHKLFYIIGSIYAVLFGIVAYFVGLKTSGPGAIDPTLLRFVGWATYFIIESFGSIIVALFWSFTASVSDSTTAKKAYPLIVAGAQLGAITGPFVAWKYAHTLGLRFLFGIGAVSIVLLVLTIRRFMKVIPQKEQIGDKHAVETRTKPKTGFLEGIKLILTRPYLLGIFAVVSIYEIVGTIIDYQMKMQAKAIYPTKEGLTAFMGLFGMAANSLALVMALLGTAYLMKRFGLTFCLLAFPITLGAAVAGLYGFIKFGTVNPVSLLWTTFAVMIIAKGLSYALNNPAKEMMYIPTSKDVKFKSKGWIDMFGSRSSKAAGSTFNEFLKSSPHLLLVAGTMVSFGLIGVWIVAALLVSRKFNKLTKTGEIVE